MELDIDFQNLTEMLNIAYRQPNPILMHRHTLVHKLLSLAPIGVSFSQDG